MNFKVPEARHVLVVGNSQTQYCVDDEILDTWVNLSRNGEFYLQTLPNLREVLKHNPHIDTVIVSAGLSSFKHYQDSSFRKNPLDFFHHVQDRMLLSTPEELEEYKVNEYYPFLYTITSGYNLILARFTPEGYRPLTDNYLLKDIMKHEEEMKKGGYEYTLERIEKDSSLQVKYLNKIIEECKKRNVKCVLFSIPEYKTDYFYAKDGYLDWLEKADTSVLVADYTNLELPDSTYYRDIVHLNQEGAQYFSRYLKEYGLRALPVREYLQQNGH